MLLDIGDSIIKDVCDYQIALLNLLSSDVSYALRANFPFLVKQDDQFGAGDHLKQYDTENGTATTGGQGAATQDVQGRHDLRHDLCQGHECNRPSSIRRRSR